MNAPRPAPPNATAPGPGWWPHPGRRRPIADSETAQGLVLPLDPRTAPTDRPGTVRGGDGGLRTRSFHPQRGRPRSGSGNRFGYFQVRGARICAGRGEVAGAFRTRPLDHTAFPYIYLDATYLHVRNSSSQVTSMAVVVAPGITAEGAREVRPRKRVVPPGLDVGTVRTRCSGVASRFAEETRPVRCPTGHQ
jgi:hypothetical protein